MGIGIWLVATGNSMGWLPFGFFGLCFLTVAFEDWLPKPKSTNQYRVVTTPHEVACEHPTRPREAIRWDDVIRISFVTTSDGPWLPDAWILLEGSSGGCSMPTEAAGFEVMWEEFKQRFAGFNYEPLIAGGTDDARYLCWEREPVKS